MMTRRKITTAAVAYVAVGYGVMLGRAYFADLVPLNGGHAAVIVLTWPAGLVLDAISPYLDRDE